MWWIIGFLILLIIVLGVSIIFLNQQVTELELKINEEMLEHQKSKDEIVNYHLYFLKLFSEAYSQLERIDHRGSFSSDDEVGFAFKVIIQTIGDVKTKLEELKLEEE